MGYGVGDSCIYSLFGLSFVAKMYLFFKAALLVLEFPGECSLGASEIYFGPGLMAMNF